MEKINLEIINTEQRNEFSSNIDTKSTFEILSIINSEDKKIALEIEKSLNQISLAVELIFDQIKNGGRVIYIGAGSSGRIGVLDASEMLPTYGVEDLFYGIIAGGDIALRLPVEGAEDSKELAVNDLKNINLKENDVVFAIGASGRTPYCIEGMGYAKSINSKTIALSMTEKSEFQKKADINIEIVTGPEVVTGSTRMKAGTATKMVLNMISSSVMIKLGKIYDNLMVDVKATNQKLQNRAIKIIKEITKLNDDEKIIRTFKESNLEVRTSIVMLVKEISYNDAKILLKENNGSLRKIIG